MFATILLSVIFGITCGYTALVIMQVVFKMWQWIPRDLDGLLQVAGFALGAIFTFSAGMVASKDRWQEATMLYLAGQLGTPMFILGIRCSIGSYGMCCQLSDKVSSTISAITSKGERRITTELLDRLCNQIAQRTDFSSEQKESLIAELRRPTPPKSDEPASARTEI